LEDRTLWDWKTGLFQFIITKFKLDF
jgi:hypothetical protein